MTLNSAIRDLSEKDSLDFAIRFITESNKIEGIIRAPSDSEVKEFFRFLYLESVTIKDLVQFVSVYQPDAVLRDKVGMNVRVGRYLPPAGAPGIRKKLQKILDEIGYSAYQTHCKYESLHPFTDGNGRSGRMLWLYCMGGFAPLGFLHTFYYQTLSESRI